MASAIHSALVWLSCLYVAGLLAYAMLYESPAEARSLHGAAAPARTEGLWWRNSTAVEAANVRAHAAAVRARLAASAATPAAAQPRAAAAATAAPAPAAAVPAAAAAAAPAAAAAAPAGAAPPGVIVLGMHRSGTSLLTGLLQRMGLWVGNKRDLVWGAKGDDNAKGFWERLDVVLGNDLIMKHQQVHWAANVLRFDHKKALAAWHANGDTGDGIFEAKWGSWATTGARGVAALTHPDHEPFVQKDPRMCVTLGFWREILGSAARGRPEPAALVTWRHPVEVASSLKRREDGFKMKRGLILWMAYTRGSIERSHGMCRVTTSNRAVNADPLAEMNRVGDALRRECRIELPKRLTQADVDEFVDSSLQRNHAGPAAACPPPAYAGDGGKGWRLDAADPASALEQEAYEDAMTVYCDLESGAALQPGYDWGDFGHEA